MSTSGTRARRPAKPKRACLSPEAKRWLDQLRAGWEWRVDEIQILEIAAAAWDRYRAARAELDRTGPVVYDRLGAGEAEPGAHRRA